MPALSVVLLTFSFQFSLFFFNISLTRPHQSHIYDSEPHQRPAFVANALGRHVQQSVTRSVAGVRLGPGTSAYQKIISNNSYAHDEQGDNPGQEKRGFDGVLYKL